MRYDEIFAVDGKVQKPKAQKPKVQKPKVQKRTGVLVTGSTSPRIDFGRRATPGLLPSPSDKSPYQQKNVR